MGPVRISGKNSGYCSYIGLNSQTPFAAGVTGVIAFERSSSILFHALIRDVLDADVAPAEVIYGFRDAAAMLNKEKTGLVCAAPET